MSKKWLIRVVAIIMALAMVLSVLYVVVGSLTAQAATTQSQIDTLKKQQKEIEKKKQEIQSQINSLEYNQKSALAKKEVLDTQIQLTEDDIANINDQIATYEQMIVDKQAEIVQAQKDEDEQLALFKLRIRTMEENGSISYLSIIFEANSFSDLLARIDLIGEIMQYDEQLYESLKAAKQATIDAEADLKKAKEEQEIQREELIAKQTELEKQLTEADALLDQIEEDIAAAKELYQQEQAAGKDIQTQINKKTEELKKQQTVKGTGSFIWPTPSCSIVTSVYGNRWHPIYHEYRNHAGIDIGAKYGASILAADGGQVIISAYSSSYGNYVVISHGNGYTTLYAHMSSRSVKEGDKVTQGQVIGKIGSTGNSTGPHLHFEISLNGSRTNPLKYYDSSTYTIRE